MDINIKNWLEELSQLETYSAGEHGYKWGVSFESLLDSKIRENIKTTLQNLFGYVGRFSAEVRSEGVLFDFNTAGNWDRFAEYCAEHGYDCFSGHRLE